MHYKNSSEKRVLHKTFKFALKPNAAQANQLEQFVGCSRYVYNWGLAKWEELRDRGQKPNFFILSKELTSLKNSEGFEWLGDPPADCLHQSILDLSVAFQNFFKHKRRYPKFHKKGQKDSIRFPHYFTVDQDASKIKVQKLGEIRYRKSRDIEGKPKSITITKCAGKWFACILCEVELEPHIPATENIVGVDVGVVHLATTFDGETARIFDHNSCLKKEYAKLIKLQRQLSHKQKGSKNRKKARYKVAKQYARIANVRLDTLHKLSTYLCKNHAAVAHEDLSILHMTKSASGTIDNPGRCVAQKRGLNRSISRQGWGILNTQIAYKSIWYGSVNVVVPPQYTSQKCSRCNYTDSHNRISQSKFRCGKCGFEINADVNAAMNIWSLAQ